MFVIFRNYILYLFDVLCFYTKIIGLFPFIYKICRKIRNNDIIMREIGERNIGILLAGGTSSRFYHNISKQLYKYNGKPLFLYSLDSMINYLSDIIVVTNSKCYNEINELLHDYKTQIQKNKNSKNSNKININFVIVINDINCRLESIDCGLKYIKNNIDEKTKIKNIIIHDSARPFVNQEYINEIIDKTKYYSQYCLKLTNGLMDEKYTTLDREKYVELCSPLCINYELGLFIFENFISKKNRNVHEFIDILKIYKIPIQLIYGKYRNLRKITYIDDL